MTPEGSPLRGLADKSWAMSLADPAAWGEDLIDRLRTNRWQPSNIDWRRPFAAFRQYGEAIDAAGRYFTQHSTSYTGFRAENMAKAILALN